MGDSLGAYTCQPSQTAGEHAAGFVAVSPFWRIVISGAPSGDKVIAASLPAAELRRGSGRCAPDATPLPMRPSPSSSAGNADRPIDNRTAPSTTRATPRPPDAGRAPPPGTSPLTDRPPESGRRPCLVMARGRGTGSCGPAPTRRLPGSSAFRSAGTPTRPSHTRTAPPPIGASGGRGRRRAARSCLARCPLNDAAQVREPVRDLFDTHPLPAVLVAGGHDVPDGDLGAREAGDYAPVVVFVVGISEEDIHAVQCAPALASCARPIRSSGRVSRAVTGWACRARPARLSLPVGTPRCDWVCPY